MRLRPNPHTWQTTRIHGAGSNSIELRGIHMSEVPSTLLGRQVMIGPLPKNLGCQLSIKRRVTHYPRATKKEKQAQPIALTINQTNKMLLRAKRIHRVSICGSCLKLLLVAYASGWLLSLSKSPHFHMALVSVSISSILNGLCLGSGVHVQLQEDTYSISIVSIFDIEYSRDLCLYIQFLNDMSTTMMKVGY